MAEHKTRWAKKVEKRPELAERSGDSVDESLQRLGANPEPLDVDPHADVPDREGLQERHDAATHTVEGEPERRIASRNEDEDELPEGLEEEGSGWYTASDGKKIRGEDKAVEYQKGLNDGSIEPQEDDD